MNNVGDENNKRERDLTIRHGFLLDACVLQLLIRGFWTNIQILYLNIYKYSFTNKYYE